MRLEWLEDILAVLEAGSLNAAAERRFVTQPAFSRRIMAIEAHLGVELLDRTHRPAQVTPAVREQRDRIRELATGLRDLRNELRRTDRQAQNRIVISCQHAITAAIAPELVRRLASETDLGVRLRSANRDECYAQLLTKQADLALLYRSETEPLPSDAAYLEELEMRAEALLPVFASDQIGRLNEAYARGEIPVVAYPPSVFLGKVVDQEVFAEFASAAFIRKRAETALTLAMKEMALIGLGVAWLPESLVQSELSAGLLTDLRDVLPWTRMTVVAVRTTGSRSPLLDEAWEVVRGLTGGDGLAPLQPQRA